MVALANFEFQRTNHKSVPMMLEIWQRVPSLPKEYTDLAGMMIITLCSYLVIEPTFSAHIVQNLSNAFL